MLSLGKIQLNGESYYVDAVAVGVDEYYRGVGEAPGQWHGAASPSLGVDGEVDSADLHAVWSGLNPHTGEKLGRFAGRKVAGFDLCFRAPKSVSLLAGLGDPDTAAAVRAAHDAAVEAAFDYVERFAVQSRTGKNGLHQIEVRGLIAAGFRHRTSRAGDPHLHTHMLVANMAEGVDGKWRTLDGRLLFQHSTTAGYLYEAHLLHELTARLGVSWEPVKEGIADISGIAPEVLDHFSDRRKQIQEHLDEVGFRSARAAELATLETRSAKEGPTDSQSMRDIWATKAAAIGFDPGTLSAVVGHGHEPSPTVATDELFSELLGAEGLTTQASTFGRRDVLKALAAGHPAGATVAHIEELADDVLARPEVVRLIEGDAGPRLATNVIRRRDGVVISAPVGEARWSTADLIGLEQRIVDRSVARAGDGSGVVTDDVVAGVLARRPTLSEEQAAMVRDLTQGGDGISVVSAAAGTGKTFTLDAVREAWQASGFQVLGAALAGRAAQELQSSAAIKSSTLAMLQIDLDAGRVYFDDRTAVVIDESGMAGTRNLAPILDAADRAGSKVVLVGDPHQLPEIDAGGVLSGLSERLDPVELIENRRQRSDWERVALDDLRSGDVDAAFASYEREGRVVSAPNAIEVRHVMVADWWSHRVAGDTAAMLAVRRSDVDDLNGRARAYLVRAGEVSGPELVIDERPYQTGDEIICLRNDRRLGVCNGTRATIERADPEARSVTIRHGDRRVELPAAYLDEGHIAHAYATTIHKAQGATFDRGLLLGTDELYRERGYVGMSRGRESNHLYLVGVAEGDNSTGHGPPPPADDPVVAVQRALTHESDQRMAIDTGDPLAMWSIEDLAAERYRLRQVLAACPPDRSHDVASLTERRGQIEQQIEPLVYRFNELADRRLRGPSARSEMSALRQKIGDHSARLDDLVGELRVAEAAEQVRERFQTEHTPEAARLDAVNSEIDRQLTARVETHLDDLPGYIANALGPLPSSPGALAMWKQRATALEEQHLACAAATAAGEDTDWATAWRRSATSNARLELVGVSPRDGMGRAVAPGRGIGPLR